MLNYERITEEADIKNIVIDDLQELLLKARGELSSSSEVYFLLTDEVYNQIFGKLMKAKISIFPTQVGINFAGMHLVSISRKRKGFEITSHELIIAVDAKASHKVLYCAIDSFEAGLQATPPLFIQKLKK